MFRSTPGNIIWCCKHHPDLWHFIKCCLKCCLRAGFITSCSLDAGSCIYLKEGFFCKIFFIMRKKIVGWIFKRLQYSAFSYHWFLCLCKTAETLIHGGFCCFPPVFAGVWGRDQTHFYLIVKRRLPWKPRWILQESPSSSLRAEINLNLGKSEPGSRVGRSGCPFSPAASSVQGRCPSPLSSDDHPITTCCYSSHFSATITWLLSSCRHREQTQRLPTLAESWVWFEARQQHWLWLWQWPSSAFLPSRGS